MSAPAMSCLPEDLYGPRASVWERFPECKTRGEIWSKIESSYPKSNQWRLFYSESGHKLIDGHRANPRSLTSAQRKYSLGVRIDGYDPEGRSIPVGVPNPANPQGTLLLAGKQLAKVIYKADA